MVAEAAESKSYPYMSPSVWTALRRTFHKQVPTKVTLTYLSSVLAVTEKTAKNIFPQLRNLGLIDQEGVPTELAQEFRFEDSYPKACDTILQTLYPVEVREIYSTPDADPAAVALWFMRHSKSGQASATVVAKFYLHLMAKTPLPDETKPRTPRATTKSTTKAEPKATVRAVSEHISEPVKTENEPELVPSTPHANAPGHLLPVQQPSPSLHVDLQVHIDSSASADQIDAIFASMAKHLYGR